jgi:hypothetical protein
LTPFVPTRLVVIITVGVSSTITRAAAAGISSTGAIIIIATVSTPRPIL